jgi:hypothetical protein
MENDQIRDSSVLILALRHTAENLHILSSAIIVERLGDAADALAECDDVIVSLSRERSHQDETIADLSELLAKCAPPGYALSVYKDGRNGLPVEWAWSPPDEICNGMYEERQPAVDDAWAHYDAAQIKHRSE